MERFQEQRAQHYSPERVAVADVDGDGTAELLLFIEGTCVRDSAEYVYRYSEVKKCILNLNLNIQRDVIIIRTE